jgi:hypothetical protein
MGNEKTNIKSIDGGGANRTKAGDGQKTTS